MIIFLVETLYRSSLRTLFAGAFSIEPFRWTRQIHFIGIWQLENKAYTRPNGKIDEITLILEPSFTHQITHRLHGKERKQNISIKTMFYL